MTREFVYFSSKATTSGGALSGNKGSVDLMKAGRMDIAIHSLISAFFLSHDIRKDVRMHLVFYGMPDPPKHIEIEYHKDLPLNKRDVANLLRTILYKYKPGVKNNPIPGCFIEKKSFLDILNELVKEGKEIYILDKNGEDIRETDFNESSTPVFILGDHEGLPKKEIKRLKDIANKVSIGPKMYFASQTIAIVNNELDRRGI